ncbi:MAG: TAXI family TRAP transporter solute-binding subunit [Deltaproteobacteria bacterium]|nr:TAXI family TRAP transporter solute-binding subunit [Deltaproteobacteria bacterium]
MKKNVFLVLVAFVLVIAWVAGGAPASKEAPPLPKVITITAYPVGSLGTVLATAFSDAIEKKAGIKSRPTPSESDAGRVLPLKKGEAELTILTAASVYFVSSGLEEFSAKEWGPQKIRYVYGGSDIPLGMGVRGDSGIKTWADLKGKRVAWPPGLFALTLPAFLAYGGLTEADIIKVPVAGYMAGVRAVMDGKADTAITATPTPAVKEWEAAPYKLYYLPMDDPKKEPAGWKRLMEKAPFMGPVWATSGALGIGGAKWVSDYPYTMVGYDFVSEHLVYTIVKAMDEGYALYKAVRLPDSEQWNMERSLNLIKPVYVPFHPGFIKYAKEKGLWTAEHDKWQAEALKAEEKRISVWKPK